MTPFDECRHANDDRPVRTGDRITVKALRHYDSVELLKPAEIDAHSGCRYYIELTTG